jgi:hypothetical protein
MIRVVLEETLKPKPLTPEAQFVKLDRKRQKALLFPWLYGNVGPISCEVGELDQSQIAEFAHRFMMNQFVTVDPS